jgi:hypothetical protein
LLESFKNDTKFLCSRDGAIVGITSDGNVFIWSRNDPKLRRIKGLKDFAPPEMTQSGKQRWSSVTQKG